MLSAGRLATAAVALGSGLLSQARTSSGWSEPSPLPVSLRLGRAGWAISSAMLVPCGIVDLRIR